MILLDTNVWFYNYWRQPLPADLRARLDAAEAAGGGLALSPVSAWEIATRQRKGKLPGLAPIGQWLAEALAGFQIVPFDAAVAAAAGADPWANPDPADRLIVQTAKTLGLELVHTDDLIAQRPDVRQTYYPR